MPKILHIQVQPKLAGAQQISFDILSNLPEDYDKHILFGEVENNEEVVSKFSEVGVTVHFVEDLKRDIGIWDISALLSIFKLIRSNRFDIVHTNSSKPAIIGRIAAFFAGVDKIIHTVHGISFHDNSSFIKKNIFRIIDVNSAFFGTKTVLVNKFYSKYYRSDFFNTSTIYNGVDFKKLTVADKSKDGITTIGFLGRMSKQKDPMTFVNTACHIIKSRDIRNVRFIMAGDGDLRNECMALVKALGIQDFFEFPGWIDDKSEFFNGIDILFQPSLWEAFGLNLVEAGYFSIPCVASNVEGIPEVVLDNHTGILSNPKNITNFSISLELLIFNQEKRFELGVNARNHVKDNFSVGEMISKYISLYEES
ncbi:glycosyltransferase family 4 protein [Vibrio sp. 10N.286.52.C3]|uniref:glycosyltransferase family 4 protein n=1 Tax=Vibrio sp. 10N.286.52.C3 TaxID=3229713 RepID=UPI00355432A0